MCNSKSSAACRFKSTAASGGRIERSELSVEPDGAAEVIRRKSVRRGTKR